MSVSETETDDGSLADSFDHVEADRSDCTLLRIDSDVLSADVIPLCAAYAAQDKGSARQAIKYLRKAAAIAESEDSTCVEEEHVRTAQGEAERVSSSRGWSSFTTQGHLALAAVTILELGATPASGPGTCTTCTNHSPSISTPTSWHSAGCAITSSNSTC